MYFGEASLDENEISQIVFALAAISGTIAYFRYIWDGLDSFLSFDVQYSKISEITPLTLILVSMLISIIVPFFGFDFLSNKFTFIGQRIEIFLTLLKYILLGTLFGLLIGSIIRKAAKNTLDFGSAPDVILRIFPAILIYVYCFYAQDIGALYKNSTRIETPYISFDIERVSEHHSQIEYGLPPESTETAFQEGSVNLLSATRAPFKDLSKILSFCTSDRPLRDNLCLTPKTAPALRSDIVAADLESLGIMQRLSVGAQTSQNTIPGRNRTSFTNLNVFRDSIDFSITILKLDQCLTGFRQRYPNGLPISDEISEVAANYTIVEPFIYEDDDDFTDSNIELSHIITTIVNGGTPLPYELDRNKYAESINDLCRLSKQDILDIQQSLEFSHYRYLVGRKIWSRTEIFTGALPYRAMINSSLLMMSGHPIEASSMLERNLIAFDAIRESSSKAVSLSNLSLPDFLARIQILSQIDGVFEYISKNGVSASEGPLWPSKIDRLTSFIELWIDENTTFSAKNIEEYISSCNNGKNEFLRDRSSAPLKMSIRDFTSKNAGDPSFTGLTESELKNYIERYNELSRYKISTDLSEGKYLQDINNWYLKKRSDYYHALANSGVKIGFDEVTAASKLLNGLIGGDYDIARCFDNKADELNIRARLIFTLGEVLAFFAQQVRESELVGSESAVSEIGTADATKFLCLAEFSMRRYLAAISDLKGKLSRENGKLSSETEGDVARARRIIARVSGVGCDMSQQRRALELVTR